MWAPGVSDNNTAVCIRQPTVSTAHSQGAGNSRFDTEVTVIESVRAWATIKNFNYLMKNNHGRAVVL